MTYTTFYIIGLIIIAVSVAYIIHSQNQHIKYLSRLIEQKNAELANRPSISEQNNHEMEVRQLRIDLEAVSKQLKEALDKEADLVYSNVALKDEIERLKKQLKENVQARDMARTEARELKKQLNK